MADFALSKEQRAQIRKDFLRGDTMADIRAGFTDGSGKYLIPLRQMRELRDEVFEPLISDPEKVKALANGSVLNPLAIIRYRRNPGRKPRMARPSVTQIEMFPA